MGNAKPGNTKGVSITVPLTSCLTGLESAVWQMTIFFAKQTNPNQSNRRSMVQWYFPPLVFPVWTYYDHHDNCKSDTTILSVTYESSLMLLETSFSLLGVSFMIFIAQASHTIIIYNPNMFIVQATGACSIT
jgi:hypothetical protein